MYEIYKGRPKEKRIDKEEKVYDLLDSLKIDYKRDVSRSKSNYRLWNLQKLVFSKQQPLSILPTFNDA